MCPFFTLEAVPHLRHCICIKDSMPLPDRLSCNNMAPEIRITTKTVPFGAIFGWQWRARFLRCVWCSDSS